MRRILVGFVLAVVSITVLVSVRAADSAPSKAKPVKTVAVPAPSFGNADSITEQELKVYLYFLASDQLEGRNLPSRGYDTAALYVASHLAEWGLKPGGSTEKTDGPLQPYFTPIELVTRQILPEQSKASITTPAPAGRGGRGATAGAGRGADAASAGPRTTAFEYGRDWTVNAGGRGATPLGAADVTGNLVFAGNGYVINKTNVNPYEGLDVRGKIIVVAGLPAELAAQQAAGGRGGRGAGAPAAAAPAEAPAAAAGGRGAAQNPLGQACTDFLTPEQYAAKNGALAVVTIAGFQQLAAMGAAPAGRGASPNGPSYQPPKLQQPPACPSAPSITAGPAMASAIFQGEKTAAAPVFYAAGANAKQESFALNAEKKLSFRIAVRSEGGHTENVIGILEGSDPALKNEYVVISAHLDHIGLTAPPPGGDTVANGADDDGSGSAGLLAMARAFADGAAKGMRPKRSVIFLWVTGEEKGLWGSQHFNQFPPVDITRVVADLNMDMIGRTKGPGFSDPDPTHVLVNPGEVLVVGPLISSDDMGKTLDSVNSSFQKMTLNHFYDTTAPDATHDNLGPQPNGQRIFYRSDHYNFAKLGIPVAFFTTGLHPDYHRASDTPDKIDYKEMQAISKTVAAVAWTLATQPARPQLKANLPEQLIKDMKTAKDQGWGKSTPVPPPLPGEPF